MSTTRRDFLIAAVAAGLALRRAAAIDPIRRTGPAKLELSLSAYSFNRFLNLRGKAKPTMKLEEFIDFAGKLDIPAVELTAYYFPRTTGDYLKAIRTRCAKHHLRVSGTAVGNDFCWPDKKRLAEQLDMVKQWSEHSAALGAKTLRIFAGSVKKDDKEADARQRCIDTIHQACDHAARHKVLLALENHGGITSTAEQMLMIVRAVKHDWFGVNLDTGNFRTPDPYADLAKLAPYSVVVQVKTEVSPGGKREAADLKKVTDLLRKATYQGYVALEYEAREDPRTAVPRHVRELKKLMG